MAIVVQGTAATTAKTVGGTSATLNLPSGIIAGEIIVISYQCSDTGKALLPGATGFTNHSSNVAGTGHVGLLYKLADGGEGATETFDYEGGTSQCWSVAFRLTGTVKADLLGDPSNRVAGIAGSSIDPWTLAANTLTGVATSSWILVSFGRETNRVAVGSDANLTVIGNVDGTGHSLNVYYEDSVTANSAYSIDMDAAADYWHHVTEIKAAPVSQTRHQAFRPRRTPWTRQPPVGILLDRSHPLTRNLVWAVIPAYDFEYVGNRKPTVYDSDEQEFGAAPEGKTVLFNPNYPTGNDAGMNSDHKNYGDQGNDITLAMLAFFRDAPEATENTQAMGLGTTNGPTLQFNHASAQFRGTMVINRDIFWDASYGPLNDRIHHMYAGDFNGTTELLRGLRDGVLIETTDTSADTANVVYDTTVNIYVGGDGVVGSGTETSVLLSLFWDRTLSLNEHKMLAANPWQIFEPQLTYEPFEAVTKTRFVRQRI